MNKTLVDTLSASDFEINVTDLINYLIDLRFRHSDSELEIKVLWDYSENGEDYPIFEVHKKLK